MRQRTGRPSSRRRPAAGRRRIARLAGVVVLTVAGTLAGVVGGPPLLQAAQAPVNDLLPYAAARQPGVAPPLDQAQLMGENVVRRTLAYGDAGLEQTLDVYTPADAVGAPAARPTVLLIHGGSWRIGDSTEWTEQAVELVQSHGWTAVSLNYRLAPRHRWPAAYEDVSAALILLHRRAAELGIDPARIGAVGDSAGGHLAALLGEPADGRPGLRAVVTWSGVNDLTGLTQQPSAGGCADVTACAYTGLTRTVVQELLGCPPETCPAGYRAASPLAAVTAGHAATLGVSSEGEQISPRQVWAMDSALARAGVPSRVLVLPGRRHARGLQSPAWEPTLRFLAGTLTPETATPFLTPTVRGTLDLPSRSAAIVRRPVRLSGVVRPRQAGSSVALQVRRPDGTWRTARTAALVAGPVDTSYEATWTPTAAGTTVWRAVWRGSGQVHATTPRAIVVGAPARPAAAPVPASPPRPLS